MSSNDLTKSFKFGSKIIKYEVHYSNRKTLGIIVTPDLSVKVRAPFNSEYEKITKIIKKKASWIIRSIDYFEVLLPKLPSKKYVSGESYYYLGRHFRLKVQKSKLEDVRLQRSGIVVSTRHKSNPTVVRTLLKYWYKQRAEKKFSERLELSFGLFKKFTTTMPKLSVRLMKTRWGSCNTKNKIILNQELIKTHVKCIDYVVVHELCHLVYRNHDRQFYNLLTSIMPDWKERKTVLEKSVNNL